MSKKKKRKRRSTAESTRRRVESRISREDLENNFHLDLTLVFNQKSLLHETMQNLQQSFIDALAESPLPQGLTHPIASGPRREKTSRRNVETLLANLFNMQAKQKPTLSISLSGNTYSHTKCSAGFINLVKLASHKSRQVLTLKKGFQDLANANNSRLARVRPTRKFWELMESAIINEDDIVSEPHDLINLRRGKNKDVVPRKQWSKSIIPQEATMLHVIESSLCWFNLVFGEYEISYTSSKDKKTHFLYPALYTVYTDNFQTGGRFYTGKGGHQNLTKIERKTIDFNGHPTVELDFGGLHIRMLYHLAGKHYPLRQDPYAAVIEIMGKNPQKIFKKCPSIREDLKTVLLALVNGTIKNSKKQFSEAVRRAEYRLFNQWASTKNPLLQESQKAECQQRRQRWKKIGLTPTKVIRAFRKTHKPIRDYFSTGCGLYLQNMDAAIARWVMFEMMVSDTDCCIPCLPLHDSFITFEVYKKQLKTAMKTAYSYVIEQATNTEKTFKIPVK